MVFQNGKKVYAARNIESFLNLARDRERERERERKREKERELTCRFEFETFQSEVWHANR